MYIGLSVINTAFFELRVRTLMAQCFSQVPTCHGWFSETASGCKSYNSASRSNTTRFGECGSVSVASESLPELCPLLVASLLILQSVLLNIRPQFSLLRLTLQAKPVYALCLACCQYFSLAPSWRLYLVPSSLFPLNYHQVKQGRHTKLEIGLTCWVTLRLCQYGHHVQWSHCLFCFPYITRCPEHQVILVWQGLVCVLLNYASSNTFQWTVS